MLIQMGLDLVEIVLRTEETFNVNLPDDECGRVITVGDVYRPVLSKLELPHLKSNEVEAGTHSRDWSRSIAFQGAEPIYMVAIRCQANARAVYTYKILYRGIWIGVGGCTHPEQREPEGDGAAGNLRTVARRRRFLSTQIFQQDDRFGDFT